MHSNWCCVPRCSRCYMLFVCPVNQLTNKTKEYPKTSTKQISLCSSRPPRLLVSSGKRFSTSSPCNTNESKKKVPFQIVLDRSFSRSPAMGFHALSPPLLFLWFFVSWTLIERTSLRSVLIFRLFGNSSFIMIRILRPVLGWGRTKQKSDS